MAVSIEDIGTRTEKCDKHGEFQSVGRKTMPGQFWTTCKQCDDERIADAKAAEEAAEKRRVVQMYDAARLPIRYREVGFGNFTTSSQPQSAALQVARTFYTEFDQACAKGSFLIFQGPPGTGKTHLALAVLRNLLHAGCSARYFSAIDMIRQLRSGWRRDSGRSELEELDILSRLDLLVIDEIGVQFSSDAERVQLFDVINRRYADLRPTILVTNLTLAEIKETLGERAFDRFREVATVVTFDWPSFRGKLAA